MAQDPFPLEKLTGGISKEENSLRTLSPGASNLTLEKEFQLLRLWIILGLEIKNIISFYYYCNSIIKMCTLIIHHS
jgi:hypothetical protein